MVKKFLFIALVLVVFAGGTAKVQAADGFKTFLPIVVKPYPEPVCYFSINGYENPPNFVTFEVGCLNVPDGWAHFRFDITGYDNAETDIAIANGIGHTEHYYPWPYEDFIARLTVTGLGDGEFDFDIPVHIYWP